MSEVVREGGDHGPGAVGVPLPGREGLEGWVFEVADHELDRGVVAMIDVGDQGRDGVVGRKAVLASVGPELCLCAEESGAADDQPESPRAGLQRSCACPVSG